MQTTTTVHGHTATTASGKLVWVPEHRRKIEHDLEGDFEALVAEHQITVPKPEPPKAAAPTGWVPGPQNIEALWIGHNNEPGHDKVYKMALVMGPDGYYVSAQYGKKGGHLSQTVKGPWTSKEQAGKEYDALKKSKVNGGYMSADSDVWHTTEKVPYAPFSGVKAPAPPPTVTIHKAPPAPPAVNVPRSLDDDFKALLVEHFGSPEAKTTAMEQGTAAHAQAEAAYQGADTGPAKITTKTEAGAKVEYSGPGGKADLRWTVSGIQAHLRVHFDHLTPQVKEAIAELKAEGAKWMPINKEWKIILKGKPWAGGKGQAQQIHDIITKHIGAPQAVETHPAKARTEARAKFVTAAEIKKVYDGLSNNGKTQTSGLTIGTNSIHTSVRVYTQGLTTEKKTFLDQAGFKLSQSGFMWIRPEESPGCFAVIAAIAHNPNPKATIVAGPKVGDTKVENGKTYRLNANHKWELVEEPKATPVPVYVPDGFPFKKIGPQAGSNEGGLYEDNLGKKWYIKFPASEAHAKNELLAAKLYKALGIDVPLTKLVKEGGKVGIASAFQEGMEKAKKPNILGANGAFDGFGADAWLGNWDVVGLGFDNLLLDKDGKAVRIDPGGSLLFRAQGTPKGDAFGTTVPEIDTLRDAGLNPQSASVFGSMTAQDMTASVAKVLEMPDEIVTQAVMKFGPGSEEVRKALAAKLIARKAYLAKRFPEADAIANPPKPDPAKLPVTEGLFPKAPNFNDWQGQGKGLSGNALINSQNQEAADKIYALAIAGNLTALQALQTADVGSTTMKSMANHASQHIRTMYNQCICTLQEIADPVSAKVQKDWGLNEFEGGDLDDLSAACKAYPYGVTKTTVPAGKRLGFWMSIADAPGAEHLAPKATHNVTAEEKSKGKATIANMPKVLKEFMSDVKDSGVYNQPYRDGKEVDKRGNKCRDVIKAAYEHAAEFKEGAIIRKHIDFHQEPGMRDQLLGKPKGHIFQNPGSMCCSLLPDWNWSGEAELEMVYAKGAKGLYNIGVGYHDNEGEITTLPGQRFVILDSKQNGPKGKPWFKLLMLPPDPTYLDTLYQKGAAA